MDPPSSTVVVVLGLLVAVIWGVTNPWMRRAGETAAPSRSLFVQWRFAVPQGINWAGSALFSVALAQGSVAVLVPVVNCLTVLLSAVVGAALWGEPPVALQQRQQQQQQQGSSSSSFQSSSSWNSGHGQLRLVWRWATFLIGVACVFLGLHLTLTADQ